MATQEAALTQAKLIDKALHVPAGRLPHLDGLRTLALLGVLLYHFDISLFNGGFVGVDIFFTLSGYLITRNILHSIRRKNFSLLSFYKRRFFRLFPASCFTILFTISVTTLFITPEKAESIYKSAVAALTLWSNVYFNREASYFDQEVEMRPLLHFWSLSVEEQFYFIWPPFLLSIVFVTTRLAPSMKTSKVAFNIMLFVGLLSFTFACYTHISHPSWTFYELPSRIFQFSIGALLSMYMFDSEVEEMLQLQADQKSALLPSKSTFAPISTPNTDAALNSKKYNTFPTPKLAPSSPLLKAKGSESATDSDDESDTESNLSDSDSINDTEDGMSIAAMIVIVFSFAFLPEDCPPYLALPTNLAAAVLIALPSSIICQLFFTHSTVAQLGRASYSIYLIHWPLAIVIKFVMQGIRIPDFIHTPILLPLSVILGFFIYLYIETPLRFPRSWRHVLTVFALGIVTICFAIYGAKTKGMVSRFPEYTKTGWRKNPESIHGNFYAYVQVVTSEFPGSSHPNIFVYRVGDMKGKKSKYVFFGDSFTHHLLGALYHTGNRHNVYFELHFAFHCGFRPTNSLKTWPGQGDFRCADTLPILWRHIDLISNDSKIVVANWWCSPVPATFARNLVDLHDELQSHGKEMAVFAEPPGIDESKRFYYPCADLRVLPLGRTWAWLLGRNFVGGKNCLPFERGNPPEWQTGKQRVVYERIFRTTLTNTSFFDIFKYLCTTIGRDKFLCRPPADLDGVVYNIGYKHDLAHLNNVGTDFVTDYVEAELFPDDNRLLRLKRQKIVLSGLPSASSI